jgi:two-component system, OmpR family, response regulator
VGWDNVNSDRVIYIAKAKYKYCMAHILIVDDEAHIRFLIRKVLESDGHIISEAADGLEGLKRLKMAEVPFNLILLDIRMPNLDGLEFLSVLRLQRFSPPVIIVTALWDKLPFTSDYNISGQLFKPFSRQKMLDLVRSVLNPGTVK